MLRAHIQGIFLSIFQRAVMAEVLKAIAGRSLTPCLYNQAGMVIVPATRTTLGFPQGPLDHGRNPMQEFWTDEQAPLGCQWQRRALFFLEEHAKGTSASAVTRGIWIHRAQLPTSPLVRMLALTPFLLWKIS